MSENENDRARGIQVYPMPAEVNGSGFDRYALMTRRVGSTGPLEVRMVHFEGVAYKVTDDKPWVWTDYDPTAKKWSVRDLVNLVAEQHIAPVDLADWVRTFSSRLESNFYLCYSWANGDRD